MANTDGHSPASNSLDSQWDGDRMFNIYIHDYCVKHGYIETAQALMREAGIQDAATPPINAKQGLLFEWWNVFWTLFSAKSQLSGHTPPGSEDALLYLQHQSQRSQQPTRLPAQPPVNRGSYVNGAARTGAHMPNGTMHNGVGPNGVAGGAAPTMANGTHGAPFTNGQPNGIHGAVGGANGVPGSQPPNMQMMPGGQRMNPSTLGQQPNPAPGGPGAQQPPQVNRGMLPPNGPPGIGPSQTPQPGAQQLGRSPSQPASPAPNGLMPSPSPSMSARQPPGMPYNQPMQDNALAEFLRMPMEVQQRLRQEAGVSEKDLPSLTPEEKQRLGNAMRRQRGMAPRPPGAPANATAGPSNPPMQHPQQRNQGQPGQQPPTPQMSGQTPLTQRGNKRNSTSPGQEAEQLPKHESSPPDRKRVRRTPGPEQQQQQQQQHTPQQQHQQPPMQAGGAPFQHPLQQGPPGTHQMPNGMRGPMIPGFPGQPMHGMGQAPGMPMQMGANMGGPHMGNAMSPGMMNHPPPTGMPMNQLNQQASQMREAQYRQSMHNLHKSNLPHGALGNMLPQGATGSPSNTDGQFAGGPPGAPGANRMGQNKPVVGMMPPPPPSPGMNAAKIMAGQNKDPGSGDSSAPNASPQNAAAGIPQGPPGVPGGVPPSTAPPTPGAGAGGMTAPSPQAMLSNHGTPAMAPSHPPQPPMPGTDPSIIPSDFLQSVTSQLDTSFGDSLFGRAPEGLGMDFERDFDEWFNPDTGGLSFP